MCCDATAVVEAALAALRLAHSSSDGEAKRVSAEIGVLTGTAAVVGILLRPFENALSGALALPLLLAALLSQQPLLPHVRSAADIHSDALLLHLRVALCAGATILLAEALCSRRRCLRWLRGFIRVGCALLPFLSYLPVEGAVVCALAHAVFSGLRLLDAALAPSDSLFLSSAAASVALVSVSLAGSPVSIVRSSVVHMWRSSGFTAALCVVFCCSALFCAALFALSSVLSVRARGRTLLALVAGFTALAADRWYASLEASGGSGLFAWTFCELFLFNRPARLLLCLGWVFCLLFGAIVAAVAISSSETPEKPLGRGWRKFWHILALVMFVPAVFIDPDLFRLASGMVVAAMALLEAMRVFSPGSSLLAAVGHFHARFAADQDRGVVTVTHIFLLSGLALPSWISTASAAPLHWLAPFSGMVSVGVGDAAASLFGRALGRHRWPCSKKTIEGTFASVICSLGFSCLLWLFQSPQASFPLWDPSVLCAVLAASFAEAFAGHSIDNLTLPLHFFTLLCLLS